MFLPRIEAESLCDGSAFGWRSISSQSKNPVPEKTLKENGQWQLIRPLSSSVHLSSPTRDGLEGKLISAIDGVVVFREMVIMMDLGKLVNTKRD